MIAFWPAYGGVHWGGRYLLPVYPLLLFLAFYVYYACAGRHSIRPMLRLVGVTLLILSMILQLLSLRLFWQRQHENTTIQAAIAGLPVDVVLTNHPFLPTMLMGLEEQFFMYVDSEEDFYTLIPRFQEQNISRFAFISVAALPLSVPSRVGNIEVKPISPVVYELVTESAAE
jgi:Na+/proline symporter